jgi:hypothetical protein
MREDCAVSEVACVQSGGAPDGISGKGHVLSGIESLIAGTIKLTAQQRSRDGSTLPSLNSKVNGCHVHADCDGWLGLSADPPAIAAAGARSMNERGARTPGNPVA